MKPSLKSLQEDIKLKFPNENFTFHQSFGDYVVDQVSPQALLPLLEFLKNNFQFDFFNERFRGGLS